MVNREDFHPQVGDLVRFRSWEDMEKECGLEWEGDIATDAPFVKDMAHLCGTEFIVEDVIGNRVLGCPENNWYITTDMLEPCFVEIIYEDELEYDFQDIDNFLETFLVQS